MTIALNTPNWGPHDRRRLRTEPYPASDFTVLILLNKPYGVLCQFSQDGSNKPVLKDFVAQASVYPAGRLDTDSEGLLALTDDGPLQTRLSHPKQKLTKVYWAQVEGQPSPDAIKRLQDGVSLKDGPTLPAEVTIIAEPDALWPREPPIRFRKNSPTSWLRLGLREGRNRQVRRMTAAVGHPTLRLIRAAIGPFTLDALQPGQWREVSSSELRSKLNWRTRKPRRQPSSKA